MGLYLITGGQGFIGKHLTNELIAAGHSVRIEEAAEIVMFSPADAHGHVLDHLGAQLASMR